MSEKHLAMDVEQALAELPIIDTHTHLVGGRLGARGLHDLLLYHMLISDLHAAGCPSGERLTARKWAERLGLFYTPTLIFFDLDGTEIIRVDSVVKFYRLKNVRDYIMGGGYRDHPTFQRWRDSQRPAEYRY